MKKKAYCEPEISIILLQDKQLLLFGSYDGPANSPEGEWDPVNMDEP